MSCSARPPVLLGYLTDRVWTALKPVACWPGSCLPVLFGRCLGIRTVPSRARLPMSLPTGAGKPQGIESRGPPQSRWTPQSTDQEE